MNKTSSAIVRTLLLGTSCLSVLSLGVDAVRAQPSGGTVVAGHANIVDHGANSTVINQTTDKALINWQSFSIAAGGTVQFNQPGRSSITLNRVIGSESSSIFGSLLANGQVWLINGNGILFGGGSRINVGGLIATTSDIANGDFMSGNYAFSGGTGASVENDGTIRTTHGGPVVMSGARVSNQGLIEADTGTVVLGGASAFTVDFTGDGLLKYAITVPAGQADNGQTGVSNSGTIKAQGGHVIMTARAAADVADAVVNNTGMISATSAHVQNGEVVLDGGDGNVSVSGTIDASGTGSGQTGGSVAITGKNITVADNTKIDVSGDAGGGTVNIGGDMHGQGPLQNANSTHVGTATITADAIHKGNGGTLVVWSNGLTDFSGVFSAKGGSAGGNGGFVETSGHTLNIAPTAHVDTSAPHGKTGTWLLDPDSIYIYTYGNDTIPAGGTVGVGDHNGQSETISPSTLTTALGNTDVTLEAANYIEIDSEVVYSSTHALSLLSGGDVVVAANVQNSGTGAINVIAGWDGKTTDSTHFTDPGVYGNGGSVYVTADSDLDRPSDSEGDEQDEFHDVAIGSAGGTTTVAGTNVEVLGYTGVSQIGFTSGGGGDIVVRATNGVMIDATYSYNAAIGNGSLDSLSGNVTGNIDIRTDGTLDAEQGDATAWIGNVVPVESKYSETGKVLIITQEMTGNADATKNILADLQGGDFTLGTTSSGGISGNDNFTYDSPHNLTLLSAGDITMEQTIQNDGTGGITLVAGWDGKTLANFGGAGAYGINNGSITIGGEEVGNVSVGTQGTLNVFADNVTLSADSGYAQLGYHGSGSGDINVTAKGAVTLNASTNGNCTGCDAQIGNGGVELNGTEGGAITVIAGGDVTLNGGANDYSYAQIGNGGDSSNGSYSGAIFVSTAGSLALNGSGDYAQVGNGGWGVSGDSSGSITVDATGAVTLTGDPKSSYGYVQIGNGGQGAEGGASGDITLTASSLTLTSGGGENSDYAQIGNGAADVSGTGNTSGDISVTVAGTTTLDDSLGSVTWIGNIDGGKGKHFDSGDVTFVTHDLVNNDSLTPMFTADIAGGDLTFGISDSAATTDMGGGLAYSSDHTLNLLFAGSVAIESSIQNSGNGGINVVAGWDGKTLDPAKFGNAGVYGNGSALVTIGEVAGDVAIGSVSGAVLVAGGDINITASNGNAQIGYAGSGSGPISVLAVRAITLTTKVGTTGLSVQIGNGGNGLSGTFGGDVTVSSNALYLVATGDNSNVQIGNGGRNSKGDASGLIDVSVASSAQLTAGGASSSAQIGNGGIGAQGNFSGGIQFDSGTLQMLTDVGATNSDAMIGNGGIGASGTAAGDIAVTVSGTFTAKENAGSPAFIGNYVTTPGTYSGNVILVAGDIDADGFSKMIVSDLSGGDFTVGITDSKSNTKVDNAVSYNSAHTFNLLSAGSIEVQDSIQNAGSGAINIVAGWNGTTLNPLHFTDSGVYGNNKGSVTIGGANATGDVAVGSAGGPLTVAAYDVTLGSVNGYAQLGYHGAGTATILVDALDAIALNGGSDAAHYAEIGDGDTFGSNAGSADVTLNGASLTVQGSNAVTANALKIVVSTNSTAIGSSGTPLRIASNSLALQTGGADAFLSSPSNGVAIAGSGVNTKGGSFTLSAGGAITQTAAILTGALDVSTTSGAITLTNSSNAFGPLTVATAGTDNANLFDSTALVVAGATVGGDLTLAAGGAMTQTGAIKSASLIVSTTTGAITLTDSGNAFGKLTATTTGTDTANINDSTALSVTSATIGGDFTLSAGGAITQTGAIKSAAFNVSTTSGAITLTNSGNSFGPLTVSTKGSDNANLFDSKAIVVTSAHVGGILKLSDNGTITQTGAIVAGGLDVSTGAGAITLTNAGNAFGTLAVLTHGSDTANIFDSTAVSVTTATVGGDFTLAAGGAITQTGSIVSAAFNVSTTSGAITLTDSGNSFGPLTVTTHGADAANLFDSKALVVASAIVGGDLTLGSGGAITQTGAIKSASLNVSTNSGAITLTDSGNTFGKLSVTTHGSDTANLFDSTAVVVTGASVGGNFTLLADGAITQTGAIAAGSLNVSTTTGAITLTNSGNAFGPLTVTTHGSDAASIYDSTALSVASATIGGGLTLSAGAAITQTGAITATSLNVSTTAGDITLTNSGNAFGPLTVSTKGSDNATLYESPALVVASANVGGTLTLTTGGAISQTGAIVAGSLNVATTSGAITLTDSGNAFGGLTLSTKGSDGASIFDSAALSIASATVGGDFTLSGGGAIGQTGAITAASLNVSNTSGDITLTSSGNAFGPLTVSSKGDATINESTALVVTGANVGGGLTLSAGGPITQTGAITAGGLTVSTVTGAITLTNAGNSFGSLSVTTHGSDAATFFDATAVAIAGANVGGGLTLTAGGAVSETGAITAPTLKVSTSSGAIALNQAGNAVSGEVDLSTPGSATFYNSLTINVGTFSVGGDVVLLSEANVNLDSSIQDSSGNITIVAGWDGTTVDLSALGNQGAYGNNGGAVTIGGSGDVAVGSQSGTTSVYASSVSLSGTNGYAQLGYHGTGGGAIKLVALHDLTLNGGTGTAMIGNGSLGGDVSGDVTGDIDIRLGGNGIFNGGGANAQSWIGNATHAGSESGNLILIMANESGTQSHALSDFAAADLAGGDVTLGFTGSEDQGPASAVSYNSSHTLNVLAAGNLVFAGSVQNAGSGAINLVAGWDGTTLTPSSFGNAGVAGNNAKGITIGGSTASGDVAVGSAGGTTSIYGASLALTAVHGYAQLGFNGHGSGAIDVNVSGGVTLTGGGSAGQFAQLGNGGLKTSGNNSGDIQVTAGGDIVLTGGAGSEAYAQIGEGGAESNTGANGYSNVAAITLNAANVTLAAGTGNASYVQIGNGGYKSGLNLAGGTATNGGAITITSGHAVTLTGNGADAYSQIGNGGSQSNLNAAASAGGVDSGDIVVHAPNGPAGAVTLTAGSGANSYSQIGNGGYAVNSGPTSTVANFSVSGNVSVTDLTLTGGNSGANAFSMIGNGDLSHTAIANISGNIFIDANGQITYINGTAPGSQATIGNFTGQGSVTGSLSGATPPSQVTSDPTLIGVVVSTTADNKPPQNVIATIQTVVDNSSSGGNTGATTVVASLEPPSPGPLETLNGSDNASPSASDGATVVIADSLDGGKKAVNTHSILAGMLMQVTPVSAGHTFHGVPPADQDFSSWGNEAFWQ